MHSHKRRSCEAVASLYIETSPSSSGSDRAGIDLFVIWNRCGKCSEFREVYPEKLFLTLCEQGHKIKERYPGIYYVTGNLPFPVQIVVTKQLKREKHRCLRVLSANADREDVEAFLSEADKMDSPRERNNIDAVLQVSVRANYELYQEIRRKSTMCEALRELMKDEIERDVNEAKEKAMREGRAAGLAAGLAEGRAEGRAEGEVIGETKIIVNMSKKGLSLEEIASMTGKELEDVRTILEGKSW